MKKKLSKKLSLNKTTISALNGSMDEIRGGAWKTYYCSNSCDVTLCYECLKLSKPPVCPGPESVANCPPTVTVCGGWNCPTF